MADSGPDEQNRKRTEPPPIEFVRPGDQSTTPPPQQPVAWVPRPEDFQRPTYAPPPTQAARGAPGRLATLAGVLLLASGVLGLFLTFSILMTVPTLQDYYNITNASSSDLAQSAIEYILMFYGQALAFVGGAMALQRKNWRLALACAAFSVLGFGVLFLGSAASGLAVVFLYMGRREFTS